MCYYKQFRKNFFITTVAIDISDLLSEIFYTIKKIILIKNNNNSM